MLLRGHAEGATTRRSASFRFARSNRTSRRRSGASRSGRRSGARASSPRRAQLMLEFVFEHSWRASSRSARRGAGTAAAAARCRRSAPCRKACCGSRSCRNGEYLDQVLYAIVEDDWRASRDVRRTQRAAASSTRRVVRLTAGGYDSSLSSLPSAATGRATTRSTTPDTALAPCSPACSSASRFWHAVTPDPQ